MNITITHEANASELAMKLGGAVHGVGGPPATLEHDGVKHPVGALGEIAGIVTKPQLSTSDWTVSSDYTAPVLEQVLEIDDAGKVHDAGIQPASPSISQRGRDRRKAEPETSEVKADESEK